MTVAFCVGLDLGKESDYAALAVVEEAGPRGMRLRHLERWPLGTPYARVVASVANTVFAVEERHGPATLVVDASGVGTAVTELLAADAGLGGFVSVTITGGEKVVRTGSRSWRVPKRVLAEALEAAVRTGTLKAAAGLRLWPALEAELSTFTRKIDPKTAHVRYEHRRGADHDDLVLAAALAVWGGRLSQDGRGGAGEG